MNFWAVWNCQRHLYTLGAWFWVPLVLSDSLRGFDHKEVKNNGTSREYWLKKKFEGMKSFHVCHENQQMLKKICCFTIMQLKTYKQDSKMWLTKTFLEYVCEYPSRANERRYSGNVFININPRCWHWCGAFRVLSGFYIVIAGGQFENVCKIVTILEYSTLIQ
jgi:hypothetical protein